MHIAPKNPSPFYLPLLLLAMCILTHAGILSHSFMIDDSFFRDDQARLKQYPHIIDFFTQNQSTHYIPLNFLLNVPLFHLIKLPLPLYIFNICLFYIDCLLLFIFIDLITKNTAAAFLTGIIFCIHPMSSEIVQHITFNIILVQLALVLTSLITLYKYSRTEDHPLRYYIISLIAASLALLCQENSLLFPFYAAALLFCMTDVSPIKIIKILTPYILLDFLLLILWQTNAGHTANIIQSIQSFQLSFFDWSANFFRMTAWYIKNLFVPGNIAFEYSQAPVIGLSYLWNFVPWTILAGSTLLVIYHFKRSAVSFAVIIFLTGFIYAAPASLSHPDIGMVFEPHWLYFSSIGFFLLIALALLKLKGCINRLLYLALASSILISFYLSTEALHLMAKNELDYCENWLRVSPHNTYAMSLLAQDYSSDKSIAIPTDLIPDMLNAIDLLIKNDYFISAPKLIGKLSSYPLSPAQRWQLLLRSAVDHCKYGTQGQCAEISERIVHSSNDPGNYIQLSYLLDEFDIDGQALALLGQCMARYPDYKEAYLLDGIILANQQHYTESIAVWERGLKIAPGDQRFIANIDKARSLSSGS